MLAYPMSCDPDLTIDVAIIDNKQAVRTVVISSGLHGIEGFFGSAVQLDWLTRAVASQKICPSRVVLVHALNPYGFANQRRANEDNVDLNRNFLGNENEYSGAPSGYAKLDRLLNPPSPRGRFDLFKLRAIWSIARLGMPAIKQAVAGGQHEFPKGCFFGGAAPSQTMQIVRDNYRTWIGNASDVVHLDLHTGLGSHGEFKLLLEQAKDDPERDWYEETFSGCVEPSADASGVAYEASGSLGSWLYREFSDVKLRFALAEFGTYSPLRVLAAMRDENRAHFFASPNDRAYQAAKRELLECFCPTSESWRRRVLKSANALINRVV